MFDLPEGTEIRGEPSLCNDPEADRVEICEIELPSGYIIDVSKWGEFTITVYHRYSWAGDWLGRTHPATAEEVVQDVNRFAKEFS